MLRRVLVAVCAIACLGAGGTAAVAATKPIPFSITRPAATGTGQTTKPFVRPPGSAQLTAARAEAIFAAAPKVRRWLDRYPRTKRSQEATYDHLTGVWTIKIWWGAAGEIATGSVDDQTGVVTEAWTGPQVAWRMARGYKGAFGGRLINTWWLWGSFCLVFLVGLVDFRRLRSWRNLDLVALLSFSVSLWYFNKGHVLVSVALVYPPLVYLLLRGLWIGVRGRGSPGKPVWPAVVLLAVAVFLSGLRIGLNVWDGNVIDVGYSGVIGAERIAHGQSPYGHFPVEDKLKACGPKDASGEIRDHIQTNGRCESANPQGDTYGPFSYEAYLPGYWIRGWSGKWDRLPAAHLTSIVWDVLCLAGLFLVGRRFGGFRLASTLTFAWAAYPFTQYASSSNTNDMIMPALLIWGFWLAASGFGRGAFGALAGWTKFAALIVAPLWWTYPDGRPKRRFAVGFVLATAAAFSVLLLEPSPLHAARVFWDRTVGWQLGRESPFSLWDWRQYHARGLPDLHRVQNVLQGLLVAAALVLPFRPRRKSPLQLAALTAALLLGFQLVLTYWIYLYIPWFFAFSAFATLAPAAAPPVPEAPVAMAEPEPLPAA